MGSVTTYEKELLQATKGLPRDKVKEVIDFINYLRLKEKTRTSNFSQRVDELWEKMRRAAEKSGYSVKDVERVIAKVRARKRQLNA